MRELIVALRGRLPGTEHITVDVVLEKRHDLGWKGWLAADRTSFQKTGQSLLWLSQDWVEYGYLLRKSDETRRQDM